jgi:hypothetical protein
VFSDKAVAVELATTRLMEDRAADAKAEAWDDCMRDVEERFQVRPEYPRYPGTHPIPKRSLDEFLRQDPAAEMAAYRAEAEEWQRLTDIHNAKIEEACGGPRPKEGDADDYTVIEVLMDTWGTWENVTDVT